MESSIFFPSVTSPTKIGEISVDILVERQHNLDSQVSDYPVEDGFPISDHVVRTPIKLSMVVGITSTPVTWLDELGGDSTKVQTALDAFKAIYEAGTTITIVTPEDIWDNMVMTSCNIPKKFEDGNLVKIPCEFKQIRIVDVKTVDIPEGIVAADIGESAGETEADGGTAGSSDISDDSTQTGADKAEVRQSTLKILKDKWW